MTANPEVAEVPKVDVARLAHSMIDLAPTDFTRDAMLGAALVLDTRENPLRLNLFASAIRIFLDHMMDALAPQEEVEACRWFRPVGRGRRDACVPGRRPQRRSRRTGRGHGVRETRRGLKTRWRRASKRSGQN